MAADTKIILSAEDRTAAAFNSVRRGLGDIDKAGQTIKSTFASLGVTLGAGFSVRAIAELSDNYSGLQARLKLASRSTEEFNAANEAVQRIAAAAQAPLLETATLYTRIASSLKDTAISQADMVNTTEAVALALRISGASAAESSSAMLQFSQAMASGVLRGEEFNAVNESAPRLLQALASSLKVGVGSLRDMAKEGQLTREVLINGLANQLPTLRKEAETLPKTFGAAFTELRNNLLLTVGGFNELSGAGQTMADKLVEIGKPAIATTFQTLAIVGANVAFVFKGIGTEIGGIAAQVAALARGDFKGFRLIGDAMKQDAQKARAELDAFEKRVLGFSNEVKAKAEASSGGSGGGGVLGNLISSSGSEKTQSALRKAFSTQPLDEFLDKFKERRRQISEEYRRLQADLTGPSTEGATGGDISAEILKGRTALGGKDQVGVSIATERAKEMLRGLKDSGGTTDELNYYSRELQKLEQDAIAMQESVAKSALAAANKEILTINQAAEKLKYQIDVPFLAEQMKAALQEVARALSSDPLRVPVMASPSVAYTAGSPQSVSIASTKFGR